MTQATSAAPEEEVPALMVPAASAVISAAAPSSSAVPTSEVEDPEVGAMSGTAFPVEPPGSLIDEKLEKVRLVEGTEHLGEIDAGVEAMSSIVTVSSDSSSSEESSESEDLETSSSSSDDESLDVITNGGEADEMLGAEEGEIRVPEDEEMVTWSDEDVEALKGPIKSKHEIEDLPPVPQVEVSLEPHHQTSSVGVISSILGSRVIVEGTEKHNPLSEGSILWITETRLPLGLVDEIFGPVKNPYYVVRYNSDKEVPAGINIGSAVSFVVEFAHHILNQKDLYNKGYDASGVNDGESTDDAEFSDDEKEAEYRRSLRQSKRVADIQTRGKQKSPFDKRDNFKSGLTSDSKSWNQESATDTSMGHPQYGRWNKNQDRGTNPRTNFQGHDRLHANEAAINRADFTAAPHQRSKQPPFPSSSAAMGQPLPNVPVSTQVPIVPFNNFRPDGSSTASGNVFGSFPPAPTATRQPGQFGTCFTDPSQQLVQQINALLTNAFRPQMATQGGYPMNALPSSQPSDMTYQSYNQNQVSNGFPNAVLCQQQFVPNNPSTANQQWSGGFVHVGHAPSGTQSPLQFTPSGQVGHGFGNGHNPWASGSFNGQNHLNPQLSMNQGGLHPMQFNSPMQFNPSVGHTSLGQPPPASDQGGMRLPMQFNPGGDQGGMRPPMQFNPSVGHTSLGQPPPASDQGGMRPPMQFNPSVGHTSLGQPPPASDQGGMRPPMQFNPGGDHGGMRPPMQFNPSVGHTSLGQPPPVSDQGGMRPPMQFNPSVGHTSLGQPPPASDQGGMRPPMQFNPGRSPFHDRNTTQRGGHHRSFGRGGHSQTR